jgi:hypothetical protein
VTDARGVTGAPHVWSRARRRRRAAWRPILGAVVLVLLVAALPVLWLAPASPGAVRVGGVSIEWWYGGLLAPVAGWALAAWALRGERDEPSAADAPGQVVPGRGVGDRAGAESVPSEPS